MKKKGFTLIELLAVILILGIIALIAIPTVNKILTEAREGAFLNSMKNVEKAAEQKCLTEKMKGNIITQFVIKDGIIRPSLDVKGEIPKNGIITLDNDCSANSILSNNNQVYVSNGDTKEVDECTETSCSFSTNLDDDDEKYECFNFDEETGTILKYDGQNPVCQGDIYIPAMINNVPVTRINHLAFLNVSEIRCKKDGVLTNYPSTYIPSYEDTGCYGYNFSNNNKFNSLNMKDAGYLTEIGNYAFSYTELNEVKFNDNLRKIGDESFNLCHFPKLVLPKNLMELGEESFQESEIEELIINNKLKEIAAYAFAFNKIKNINIPDGVEKIDEGAFAWGDYSGASTVINISDTVKIIEYIAFMEVGAIEVNFGKNVEKIGGFAFDSNLLTSVQLPLKLKVLEEAAFTNNRMSAGNEFIYNLNSDGSTNNKSLNSYGGISDSITIPATIEELGVSSVRYAGCTSIVLQEGLKYIREGALDGNNLTTITIPSTVEIIEKDGINKRSNGNRTLTTIINKTGKSFDWSTITGSLTPNQSFETGTISHNYGNINVTK